ncbi:MAG: glycosyltransferase [Armatimonadota bacterium]|nr:glycosyltransferase [Armatimonadota bacterium]
MPPITVLHVIDSLRTGGAEQQLALNMRHTDTGQFRHVVCSLSREARFTSALRESGIPVVSLNLAPQHDYVRGIARLRQVVRERRPDILHVTLFRASLIGRAVGRLAGLPVLTSLVSPTYAPEWRIDDPHLHGPGVRIVYYVDRFTARAWGTWFLAISEAVKTSAVRQLGIPAERITVIPRGLSFDGQRPVPESDLTEARAFLGSGDRYPVILSVGRLVPQKGQRYAIAAMTRVVAAYPRARLVIVGDGWMRNDLQASIDALGLGDHVVLAGERRDVDRLLQAADLFVFPSLSEGFGVALLEALAAGRAAVVSRIPALVEVTDHGRVAVLTEPRSPEAIAEGLLRLAADRDEAARLGAAAAAWARERYDIKVSMQTLEALYRTLAARAA